MEKNWYAVYTRPRWEKKVAELLLKKNLDHYCPLNRVLKQWADRKKIIYEPLFPSYVFVHLTDQEMTKARDTDGVINFVYWLSKPAVIREDEIDCIKDFLNDYSNVQLQRTTVLVNDNVRITKGPLMEYEGSVIAVKSRTVKVVLPSLGYMMVAEVPRTNVQVIVDKRSVKPDSARAAAQNFYQ